MSAAIKAMPALRGYYGMRNPGCTRCLNFAHKRQGHFEACGCCVNGYAPLELAQDNFRHKFGKTARETRALPLLAGGGE